LGFADRHLADVLGVKEGQIRAWTKKAGIKPVYKMVDTCAAEFEAETPYFYSCYDLVSEDV
jgi:carbamoyl-phosphate synthase large subunit